MIHGLPNPDLRQEFFKQLERNRGSFILFRAERNPDFRFLSLFS
jgi:hypothetical protein